MNASPSARHAPRGALRIGLVLVALGLLLGFGPVAVPGWAAIAVGVAGGLLLAVAFGIRTLPPGQ